MKSVKADDYISVLLNEFRTQVENHFKSDVITIKSPMRFGLDDIIRLEIETLYSDENERKNRLTVFIQTTGGFIETVERIYNVFCNHYNIIDFIVPNYAYSAGTVLVLSGDNIYMDYYSILGPIDPQYEVADGRLIQGLGYLEKYNALTKFINECTGEPREYRAELAYLLKKFDPGVLYHLEQAKEHSISLLEEWLPKHKFKTWKKTKSRGKKVTPKMRKDRASEIAEILSNPSRWHSHGRGIGFKDLTSEEIRLEIIDFGKDNKLNKMINQYYDLLLDYCQKTGFGDTTDIVIHCGNGLRRING